MGDWSIFGKQDERLTAVLDLEVVEKGLEVVLGGKAGIEQEALDAGPLPEALIVEHLQVILKTLSFYRQEKSMIPPQIYPFLPTSARKQSK